MPDKDDWRRQGQENYLKGITLSFRKYGPQKEGWNHDHCEFCGAKFMDTSDANSFSEGYTTSNNYRWICRQCFDDFKAEYEWKVENSV